MKEKQIEEERWEIAKIMADNFHINGEGWDDSDFEWTALCLQMEGYRKQSDGEWVANPHISISKRGRTIHYGTFKCSVCGKWNGRKKQKYCPNCGAKMKGE